MFSLTEIQKLDETFDLYLRIDDGDYNETVPEKFHPQAWWISDTHLKKPFQKMIKSSCNCDYIFCCQKEGAKQLATSTSKKTFWIPPAADELSDAQIFKEDEKRKWDVCFIGTKGKYSLRKVILEKIKINYPNSFIGRVDYSKIYDYYSRSKIVVNYPINNDINMRTFEAMGAGALVLMFRIKDNGFNSIFTENKNLVVFDDIVGGLKTKIDYYLKNTEERMRIAKEGFNLIRNNHTYRHRLLEMFKIMGFKLEG